MTARLVLLMSVMFMSGCSAKPDMEPGTVKITSTADLGVAAGTGKRPAK
ncbi:MAG: hypothetical protein JNJ77_01435 [Planctomycetia bacterium]|nr:hypothetical protein [Planctomycetia bacterium]